MELSYYHIPTQLCQAWQMNLSQIHHITRKYHMQVCVYLGERNPITKGIPLHPISDIDIMMLSNMPIKKLKALGFTAKKISQIISKKATHELIERKYLFSNKTAYFINIYHHELPNNSRIKIATGIRTPDDLSSEIPNDGYIEIDNSSFINSSMTIKDLFSQPNLDIFQVKCNKQGYAVYLDKIYSVSINDAYISSKEKLRLEILLKINNPNYTVVNEPTEERDRRYQQRTNDLLAINSDLSKESIAHQIHIEETNHRNNPPSPERIVKIIRTNTTKKSVKKKIGVTKPMPAPA